MTSTNNNRIDVLIIEDNPADALLIKRTLLRESEGSIHVEQVDRLSDGIDRIAKGGIDAILLDLSLPDSYGRETFQQLHAQSPGAPIVVLTGLDDESLAIDIVKQGAQDYLIKGEMEGRYLVRCISYAIERKRVTSEREQLIKELQEAMANIRALTGLLPICSACKMIRDDEGYWNQLEAYITAHSDVEFSHGLCPSCAKQLFPDYID